ncbi:ribose 5-phosphate isomerase B [Bacillus sp. SORGH_AS 510]|uniref:ribose 5-phosphate isomerase B n=1 Tax=Bacillus sp. SORGH_AS_0510 TaxID=3041771 RepID=UPI0027883F8E|nr:ribose 5-phosphate isomerase B [Bacillus sp. SORGH_AS_0510]MDQ1143794.1 ribose 5-phosphate isomerase B [Bacillus sp. SORGH_AS_0510]
MKIGIGCDHNGFDFKEAIKDYLQGEGVEIIDYGCHSCSSVDYPDVAFEVSKDIIGGKIERGILICGTGLGVAIAANKYPGIRAATCHDVYSAERAQKSNNAQIMTMGAQVIGPELGKKLAEAFLKSSFNEERSGRKVQKIIDKENEFFSKSS